MDKSQWLTCAVDMFRHGPATFLKDKSRDRKDWINRDYSQLAKDVWQPEAKAWIVLLSRKPTVPIPDVKLDNLVVWETVSFDSVLNEASKTGKTGCTRQQRRCIGCVMSWFRSFWKLSGRFVTIPSVGTLICIHCITITWSQTRRLR